MGRVDSNTVANIAVTLVCGMFLVLGGLRLVSTATAPQTPLAAQRDKRDNGIAIMQDKIRVDDARVIGSHTAPITIVEFSDFECPYCAKHALNTLSALKKEFIDSGQVRYAFKHFPLPIHSNAGNASEAAECAGQQGRFWIMHDYLFANQQSLNEDDLYKYGRSLGLEMSSFKRCMDGDASKIVANDRAEGSRLGVTGTPTFFVGRTSSGGEVNAVRRVSGLRAIDLFRAVIGDVQGEDTQNP